MEPTFPFWRPSRNAMLLFSLVGVLLISWSFIVPIYEAPDEGEHWKFARYLHDTWQLPLYSPSSIEANSPPLYYGLIAPFAVATDEPTLLVWWDGRDQLVVPKYPVFIQTESGDLGRYWPLRIARLLTGLMSLVTVVLTYYTGRLATGAESTGLLAAGLLALLPMFTFRGAQVSNDALLGTFGALVVLCMVKIVKHGFSWRLGLFTAVAIAAAFLTKISAICLVAPVGLAILSLRTPLRTRLGYLTVFALTLLLVLPWVIRNQMLYGDPFASHIMVSVLSNLVDKKSLTSPYFYTIFPFLLFRSTVGIFGQMNFYLPEWMYTSVKVLIGFGIIGLIWGAIQRRINLWLCTLLALTFVLNTAVIVNINIDFTQPQGRYFLPALSAMAVLLAIGYDRLFFWSHWAHIVLISAFAALNIYILCWIVMPTYWPPAFTHVADTPVSVYSTATTGLSSPESTNMLRVIGPNPRWIVEANADVDSLPFLQFELAGSSQVHDVTGRIYFILDNGVVSENQSMYFDWKADGTRRLITVPMYQQEHWHGQVKEIYIDPYYHGFLQSYPDAKAQIDAIFLTGRLR